jgi:hypothetical protein
MGGDHSINKAASHLKSRNASLPCFYPDGFIIVDQRVAPPEEQKI